MKILFPCLVIYMLIISMSPQYSSNIILDTSDTVCNKLKLLMDQYESQKDKVYINIDIDYFSNLTKLETICIRDRIGISYLSDTDFYCDYIAFAKKLNCYDQRFTVKEILFYDSIRPIRIAHKDSLIPNIFKQKSKNKN